MELDSVARLRTAWYRALGTDPDDDALTDLGEAENEVADTFLTRGARAGQRFMLAAGMSSRWKKRSAALSWSGSETADGGRYTDLPADFLRFAGTDERSALESAEGEPWGQEIHESESRQRGDFYYLKNDQLWITRAATPPATLYLAYHFTHPAFADAVEVDFPMDARPLLVAEAAYAASLESWYAGDADRRAALSAALDAARRDARDIARRSRTPRRMSKPVRFGNRW